MVSPERMPDVQANPNRRVKGDRTDIAIAPTYGRKNANAKPDIELATGVADAVAAMEWLVGYGCSCDTETRAWEDMANARRYASFDVVRLTELRDPKELGRTLREDPPRVAMLTSQSHL